MTIVAGIVQPDYDSCPDGPVGGFVEVPGPAGPTGPQGPPGTLCPLFCGTGSPEGVVTSPIGGIYEQTDAASTSHSVWFKHSGVGNTGWRQWAGLRGGDGANTALRIGDNSIASGVDSVAIGENAEALALTAIAIGKEALATTIQGIAIGDRAEIRAPFSGSGNIVIGPQSYVEADKGDNIVIGRLARAIGAIHGDRSQNAIVIGFNVEGSGWGSICIGDLADTRANDCTAVGHDSSARELQCTAIGSQAVAGIGAGALATHGTAIGTNAGTGGHRATALGAHSFAGGREATALGNDADSTHDYSIALGTSSTTSKANQLVIGSSTFLIAAIDEIRINSDGGTALGIGPKVGSDVAGDKLQIHGGAGTGIGTPGIVEIQTFDKVASGVTPQTVLVSRLRISHEQVDLLASGFRVPIREITVDETLTLKDLTVICNSGSAIIATLPTAASCFANGSGQVYIIKRVGGGAVTIEPDGAETIDGAANRALAASESVQIISDGTTWWII